MYLNPDELSGYGGFPPIRLYKHQIIYIKYPSIVLIVDMLGYFF